MDIIVTTPKAEMENSKQEAEECIKNGGGFYFRRLNLKPKNLNIGDKVFYVEDGYVRGFAIVYDIKIAEGLECLTTGRIWNPGTYIIMKADSWQWIKPIPMKGFQGWRYFDEKDVIVVGNWLSSKPSLKDKNNEN